MRAAIVALVALTLLASCADEQDAQPSSPAPLPLAAGVPLDHPFRFDPVGALPLDDTVELPAAPGAVTVQWYTFRGWYTAVFDGLNPTATAPPCLGVSIRNRATGRFEHISHSPLEPRACDDRGAGAEVLGAYDPGARACEGLVSYVTRIPSDIEGTLLGLVMVFPGDGTGIGLSGQLDTSSGRLDEIDETLIGCAGLPQLRQPAAAESDVAPPSAGDVAAADRAPPPAVTDPGRCPVLAADGLEDVTSTDGGPYLAYVPRSGADGTPVVVFLPGGSGGRGSAESVWARYFAGRPQTERFLVVIPYVLDGDLLGEARRVPVAVNELLWCLGADPWRVHLAGTSNGGLAAFALMTTDAERFATLAGAPGAFPVQDPASVAPEVWARLLAGRAVLNGVGALDEEWRAEVIATHNALAAADIESRYVEFPGEGHVASADFDASALFEFWGSR